MNYVLVACPCLPSYMHGVLNCSYKYDYKKNSLRGQNSPAGSKYRSTNIQYFNMSNIRKNDYHEKWTKWLTELSLHKHGYLFLFPVSELYSIIQLRGQYQIGSWHLFKSFKSVEYMNSGNVLDTIRDYDDKHLHSISFFKINKLVSGAPNEDIVQKHLT